MAVGKFLCFTQTVSEEGKMCLLIRCFVLSTVRIMRVIVVLYSSTLFVLDDQFVKYNKNGTIFSIYE